jgi:hypothetical protein
VLAVSVLTATIIFGTSLTTLISQPSLYGWDFNYALFSTDGYGPLPSQFVRPILAKHPDLITTGAYFGTLELDGQAVPLIASPAGSPMQPPLLSGHPMANQGELLLGSATLASLHRNVGDTVVLSGGNIASVSLKIVGTAIVPTIGETLGTHPSMSTGAFVPHPSDPVFSPRRRDTSSFSRSKRDIRAVSAGHK